MKEVGETETWRLFERLVVDILTANGFEVELSQVRGGWVRSSRSEERRKFSHRGQVLPNCPSTANAHQFGSIPTCP